ncbi:TIR domain-containing protein, partial [Caballeronia sp. RCC_10]|uniref:TIR domain-containing protein n=1 Tax=Caballeronia sp. RCC_10 TaxID=3239227 RepID=UPI0035248271
MNTYNLLISHSWKYSDAYDRLVALLQNRGYFDFRNYSVPRIDPIIDAVGDVALERAIRDQMRPCHAMLILGGVYSTYSKWINKEIALAKEFKKGSFENGVGNGLQRACELKAEKSSLPA